MNLKRIIKSNSNRLGFDLSHSLILPLKYFDFDLVLDVGANAGQYALSIRDAGYKKEILSFEPLSRAHFVLTKQSKKDANWKVFERCAVGDVPGIVQINESLNSYSSSILNVLESHTVVEEQSKYVRSESTPLISIDAIYKKVTKDSRRVFLKIDTQGYEERVLLGAKESLELIDGIRLELSIIPLYEGQELYPYFFEEMKNFGFQLWSLSPGFANLKTGQLLQFDATFIKSKLIDSMNK